MKKHVEDKTKDTKTQQKEIEELISSIFIKFNYSTIKSNILNYEIKINTENHIHFINKMISHLPGGYLALDSGMPWFAYWTLNCFDLFGSDQLCLPDELKSQYITYLQNFINSDKKGFSGYHKNSFSHLISTYAAVLAIVCLDSEKAYSLIDKKAMKDYLMLMKKQNTDTTNDIKGNFLINKKSDKVSEISVNYSGAFQAHVNGESDLRATYCALVIAYILNILDDDLTSGVAEHIAKCQTYEGGFGPEPYSEAHGGYNFCAISSLLILNKLSLIDINKQIKWLTHRQMTIEGGFQGRTNKLVDSCYSFWQGSVFNMLMEFDNKHSYESEMLYDQYALQAYILLACQKEYGLVDKPGKSPDLFHLNYAGVGFSLSQQSLMKEKTEGNDSTIKLCISYDESTELAKMDPIFCVSSEKLIRAINYYKQS